MKTDTTFTDLFSRQSLDYSRFRPTYPAELFRYLSSLVDGHDLVWDVGTGNGQAAVALAEHFERVIATDPSAKQISTAQAHPKVEYRVGGAEKSTVADHSADLITAAQCFHWFRPNEFFAEARRILKPGGAIAFWCYGLSSITPEVDAVVGKLYHDILGAYWLPENRIVERLYRDVQTPLKEITAPKFLMTAEWSLEHLIGYLSTWSALQTYIQKNKSNPLESLYPELNSIWNRGVGASKARSVSWELALRVGRFF